MKYLKQIKTQFIRSSFLIAVMTLLLAAQLQSNFAYAAPASGITITPPTNMIALAENQEVHRLTIMIINQTKAPVELQLTSRDFGSLEASGGLLLLGTEVNETWDKHRLAKWIELDQQTLHLAAGEQKELVATIYNSESLAPGGHYAAIVAQVSSASENSKVSLNQAISSLLFVNKEGGAVLGIKSGALDADIAWWGQVKNVKTTLTNTGNTHVVPRGFIAVRDPLNRIIASGVINPTSTIILPNNKQVFSTNLEQKRLPWWPGKYSLVLSYRYDGQDNYETITKELVSPGIYVTFFIILLFPVLGFLGWRAIRRKG